MNARFYRSRLEAQLWSPPRLSAETVHSFGVGTGVAPQTLEKLKRHGYPIYEMAEFSHPKVGTGWIRTRLIYRGQGEKRVRKRRRPTRTRRVRGR